MSLFCFCNQKTAYEMRIIDWSSDVVSSDLCAPVGPGRALHLKKIGLAAVPAGTVHAGDQPHGRGIDMEALCVQYERVADMRVEDFGDDDELTRPGLHAVKRPDRKSTRLNSSHYCASRMPSSACYKKLRTHLTRHLLC